MNYYQFKEKITASYRYIFDDETLGFLENIAKLLAGKEKRIEQDTVLYRAQLGSNWQPIRQEDEQGEQIYIDDEPSAFDEARMRPMQQGAHEGRLNPKGIPYTYLALDEETALAEIRPWLEQEITLAKFSLKQQIKVADLTQDKFNKSDEINLLLSQLGCAPDFKSKPLTVQQKNDLLRYDLDKAFSQPMVNFDDAAKYAPTQIIAELIKSKGYDGALFKSSVTGGANLVLFDGVKLNFLHSCLRKLTEVKYKFQPILNRYNDC